MPFNTRNPIPSGDLRDLDDNARNIDTWANDKTKLSHPDRFGVERRTWHGIEQEANLNIQRAIDAKNAAQEAAMMSGFSKYADTVAQLESGIGTDYVDGDVVMVFQDESRGDTSSIFKIESGAAEFKLTFDKTRQDLLSFTGTISADAEWSDVPAHSDPAFDVQAQALANRTQVLNKRTEGLLNVRAFIETPIDGVTSNQDGIEAAVAAAFAAGAELEWPAGTYVSTANIPNFWDVKHTGRGVIKRDSALFFINPRNNHTNTLRINPSAGVDTNDGLVDPLKTVSKAFEILQSIGGVLGGQWILELSSGIFDYPAVLSGVTFSKHLIIKGADVGGHPNIPTSIVGPETGVAATGWRFTGLKVEVRDVWFRNFNSGTSAFGLGVVLQADLRTQNVHATNSYLGIVGNKNCLLDVKGGIIDGCNEGIRSLFNCSHTIGQAGAEDLTKGPIIRNCSVGFSARESSTGHCDWVSFEDNEFGLSSEASARINCSYSDFKRNVVAIRARDGNVLRTGCTFHEGTPDSNNEVIRVVSNGTDFTRDLNSQHYRVRARSYTEVTSVGGQPEVIFNSFSIPKSELLSIITSTYFGKVLKIRAAGGVSGVGGNKFLRLRLDGLGGQSISGLTIVTTGNGRWELNSEILIKSHSDIRVLSTCVSNVIPYPVMSASRQTVDLNSAGDFNVNLTGNSQTAGDNIYCEFFEVSLSG